MIEPLRWHFFASIGGAKRGSLRKRGGRELGGTPSFKPFISPDGGPALLVPSIVASSFSRLSVCSQIKLPGGQLAKTWCIYSQCHFFNRFSRQVSSKQEYTEEFSLEPWEWNSSAISLITQWAPSFQPAKIYRTCRQLLKLKFFKKLRIAFKILRLRCSHFYRGWYL